MSENSILWSMLGYKTHAEIVIIIVEIQQINSDPSCTRTVENLLSMPSGSQNCKHVASLLDAVAKSLVDVTAYQRPLATEICFIFFLIVVKVWRRFKAWGAACRQQARRRWPGKIELVKSQAAGGRTRGHFSRPLLTLPKSGTFLLRRGETGSMSLPTIDSADAHQSQSQSSPVSPPAQSFGRRVNRSCIECTRRKIKCDGRFPCSSCVYYRASDACEYRQRSRRNASLIDHLASAHEDVLIRLKKHEDILEKLFPGYDISQLDGKSRPELLDELGIRGLAIHSQLPHARSSHHASLANKDPSYHGDDDSAPLSENGDPAPEPQWDESLDQRETVATDDINAIGLATDKQARSYLGISSMSAAFRAIFRLYPPTKDHTAARARACAAAPPMNQLAVPTLARDPALSLLREQRCIDFYFDHFHAVTPLIDEEDFRKQYATGGRRDGSWLGLLNMVFALGSIASGSESLHEEYYKAARASFSLDSLGSGNLYSLQALCLLGGFYLHYRNSPNMAYGILGAAHRVALALGLHREPRRTNTTDPDEVKRAETRRRTWWSLVCVDSWACMTQGRPTCGRWEHATMDTALPSALRDDDHAALSLRASAQRGTPRCRPS
ncbi:hypothetical protein PWT90_10704 [Aphanocladium album]|nr:hypothetical protein PWT90_10704 [Aphanocladium album]